MRVTIAPSRRSPLTASPLATHCTADSKCINMETERRKSTRCQPAAVSGINMVDGRAARPSNSSRPGERANKKSRGRVERPARTPSSKMAIAHFSPARVFHQRDGSGHDGRVFPKCDTPHTAHSLGARLPAFLFCSARLGPSIAASAACATVPLHSRIISAQHAPCGAPCRVGAGFGGPHSSGPGCARCAPYYLIGECRTKRASANSVMSARRR